MSYWQPGDASDSISENYALHLVPAVFETWATEVIQHAQPRPGDTVLDVACGTGVVTFAFARMVGASGRVIGIDINPGMLRIADRVRNALSVTNVSFRNVDAQDLPYPDGAFDRVVCEHALMFFSDKARAVREMYRVLSRGGRMVITVWSTRRSTPHEAVLADAFNEVLGMEPDFFPTLFNLGEIGSMEQVLRDAGVRQYALIERVRRAAVFLTADAYWQGTILGRPIAPFVAGLPVEQQRAIRADAISRLEPYRTHLEYNFPMEAVIVTLTKP